MTYFEEMQAIKQKLLSLSESELSPEVFSHAFYGMHSLFGMTGNYFDCTSLWISSKPFRIFKTNRAMYCFQFASGTIRHIGLPVVSEYSDLVHCTECLLRLGINLHIGERDLPEVTSTFRAEQMQDNFIYNCSILETYPKECSRQTRKILNRLHKDYTITVYNPSEASVNVVARIPEITATWLQEFKNSAKEYSQTLSYIENLFKYKLYNTKSKLITYTNNETGVIEAYDYFEVFGKTGIAIAGKSIIPKVSTFKYVTLTIIEEAKKLGAEFVMIGQDNTYDIDKNIIKPGYGGLTDAKKSLPHEMSFTYFYKYNHSKYSSVEIKEKANDLF